MFLLPGLGCPNFCRMTDQAFDSQLFHEVHKPLHRSRGFDAHSHRAWKRGIKLPHVVAFVLQSHAHYFPRFGVQHCHCLLASVQITSYNSHLGLLRSEHCRVNTEQFTRAVARPASLWHQPEKSSTGNQVTGNATQDLAKKNRAAVVRVPVQLLAKQLTRPPSLDDWFVV